MVEKLKRKRNMVHAVETSGTEKAKVTRKRLVRLACAATRAMVTSRPELLSRTTSGSVWMSVASVTTQGRMDAQGLGCHLRPSWCVRAMLPPFAMLI